MTLLSGILLLGLQSAGVDTESCERPTLSCETVQFVKRMGEKAEKNERAPVPRDPPNPPAKKPTDGIQNGI